MCKREHHYRLCGIVNGVPVFPIGMWVDLFDICDVDLLHVVEQEVIVKNYFVNTYVEFSLKDYFGVRIVVVEVGGEGVEVVLLKGVVLEVALLVYGFKCWFISV